MKKYSVSEYIDLLNKRSLISSTYNIDKVIDVTVNYMSYNSQEIQENTLFICKGAAFKKDYLLSAISNGVIIYVSQEKYDIDVPCIIVTDIKEALSALSSLYFNNPANKLNIIGITGTKGKSTTSYFVKYIFDEWKKANDKKDIGIISSIYTYDGKDTVKSLLTTPESFDLHRIFSNDVKNGVEDVVMEVSSQALKYSRVSDVKYKVGVFLNISEDHIGPVEHPDFEDYFNSKLKLFSKCDIACVNLDSDYNERILNSAKTNSKKVITFSTKDKTADVYAHHIHKQGFNTVFAVKTKEIEREFELTIPGLFNVENALAAICVAMCFKIPDKYIYLGLKEARSPGRMEIYHSKDEKIVSIVDYAHNKLSFQKIFETTKKEYPDRKIVAIFGCTGNKAENRRKDLGEEAGKNADMVYVTADDPAYEPVLSIAREVERYLSKYTKNYMLVEDRSIAIKEAVEYVKNSKYKYIILILGKGNEKTQKVGGGIVPYKSDRVNIQECIKEYEESISNI